MVGISEGRALVRARRRRRRRKIASTRARTVDGREHVAGPHRGVHRVRHTDDEWATGRCAVRGDRNQEKSTREVDDDADDDDGNDDDDEGEKRREGKQRTREMNEQDDAPPESAVPASNASGKGRRLMYSSKASADAAIEKEERSGSRNAGG